jgi:hypothetical protein
MADSWEQFVAWGEELEAMGWGGFIDRASEAIAESEARAHGAPIVSLEPGLVIRYEPGGNWKFDINRLRGGAGWRP